MKNYSVVDVINAGCNLEPIRCVKCEYIGEVTFNQYTKDAYCAICGTWQIELFEEALKFLKDSGRFEKLGFITDEEINKIDPARVVETYLRETNQTI